MNANSWNTQRPCFAPLPVTEVGRRETFNPRIDGRPGLHHHRVDEPAVSMNWRRTRERRSVVLAPAPAVYAVVIAVELLRQRTCRRC